MPCRCCLSARAKETIENKTAKIQALTAELEQCREHVRARTSVRAAQQSELERAQAEAQLAHEQLAVANHTINTLTTLTHSLYAQHFQSFRILSGNVNSIKNTVDMFNNGRFRVLLVNAYVYGCGLNLMGATDVIFFQKTNNEVEKQLVGRANRIGRTHELNIHRVLHDSE